MEGSTLFLHVWLQVIPLDITVELQKQIMSELEILYKVSWLILSVSLYQNIFSSPHWMLLSNQTCTTHKPQVSWLRSIIYHYRSYNVSQGSVVYGHTCNMYMD